jgi:formyltetrahydrofolate synthetase
VSALQGVLEAAGEEAGIRTDPKLVPAGQLISASRQRNRPQSGRSVRQLASELGIMPGLLHHYREGVAEVRLDAGDALSRNPAAACILVAASTPTPLEAGKTVVRIGLGDGLCHLDHRSGLTLPRGSMGPTSGIRGAEAEGRQSTLVPFDRCALDLTWTPWSPPQEQPAPVFRSCRD